jgi:very-short-patch-repair endonuclease
MSDRRATAEPPPPRGAGAGGGGRAALASPSERARSPLPCGEGAGGEGRQAAALIASTRTIKRGHSWAPEFGEDRQKDHARTKLRARRQRKEMTSSEKELWKLLRSIDGHTFRRQPAIGDYVFDFASYGARLLIEIDGSIHERDDVKANDKAKEVHAITQGFRVLRFANNDVWDRPAWVIAQVRARLSAPHPPTPSPQGRGGESEP